jgi:outer membrane protein assembly factor BamB
MGLLLTTLLLVSQLRFAWLTDLHVGSGTGLDDLHAAVADIGTLPGIRFVLVTGDITESGSTADLLSAKAALDRLTVPYYIVPGNHDTKWSESGTTAFPAIFGSERFAARVDSFLLVGFHQGPRMRMADGHFAPEDLRWLDSALAPARLEKIPVLVATHYPLDSGISNWFEAVERLLRVDTRLVFVGHGHANRGGQFGGLRGVMGRSLLRNREEKGGYNIVTIEGDRVAIAERTTGERTADPWYKASLDSPHPPPAGLRPHTDFSVNDAYPFVRERWKYSAGSTILAGAAFLEDRVLAADFAGRIHALRVSDGQKLWEASVNGHIVAAPAAATGRVVVTSTDSTISCFEIGLGKAVWTVRTGAPMVAAPLIDGITVYTGGGDGYMRAVDLQSGRLLWRSGGIRGFVEARPAASQEAVFVGAWDETMYAFRKRDGVLLWQWNGGLPGKLYSPAACWPVISGQTVFVVAPDRIMTALDLRSGNLLWRSGKHLVRESIGSAQDGSLIYVRAMRDSMIAVSAAGPAPEDVWSTDADFGYDINAAMPVECEGVLFFGTMKGVLLAFDARNGSLLWKHRVGPSALNTLTPVNREQVICTDFDGQITLVEAGPS